jgi:16S rRNA (adenine1518-N6/adenine1519-N6)-dimethyltransferase
MHKDNNNSLKKILVDNQISAKKRFGQNFLHDKNIIRQIVRASKPENKNIIEVGPGPGLLTKILLESGTKSIFAIEKDESFLPILNNLKKESLTKFDFLIADILKVDLDNLIEGNYSVVSNLPYNISVPFIISLVEQEQPVKWESLTLTVQKEVADRMMADINSKQYGRLSVLIQWRSFIEKICDIKPTCFIPEPKVMSTVIRIRPKNYIKKPSIESFQKVVSAAFGFRRKTLKRSLGQLGIDGESLAIKAGINPKLRAQNLTVDNFCDLAKIYEDLKIL